MGLHEALSDHQRELSRLVERVGALEREWAVAKTSLQGTYDQVHRELGHITRKKRELLELSPCPDESTEEQTIPRRSRFAGGRRT